MTVLSIMARLNDHWCVQDDGLQWILARRCGRKGVKRTGWAGKRYHRQRTPLIAAIGELCGLVDPDAMTVIRALPERYGKQRLGVAVVPEQVAL